MGSLFAHAPSVWSDAHRFLSLYSGTLGSLDGRTACCTCLLSFSSVHASPTECHIYLRSLLAYVDVSSCAWMCKESPVPLLSRCVCKLICIQNKAEGVSHT